MAWLRLTLQDGRTCLVNSDQVSEVYNDAPGRNTDVRTHDGVTSVRESVDEIAAMIEQAEWRERVLKCACAIVSCEYSDGLTSEQIWTRAARFAMMEPERPVANT